jgi:hypothetical protein
MLTALSLVINLYVFPTGRRLYALRQVTKRAKEAGHADLVKHCNAAIAADRDCLVLERRWAGAVALDKGKAQRAPDPNATPAAHKVDAMVDRTLTAIRDHADNQRAGVEQDDPIYSTVASFLAEVFPSGVSAVTGLPFVEEVEVVDSIVTMLFSEKLAPVVEELGLGRLAKRLADLAKKYRAAIEAPAPATLLFGEVRAARKQGQERLLETVAIILGKHHASTPEEAAARENLLGPIMEQNAAIGESLRNRVPVPDVNPSTGEPDPSATAPVPDPEPAAEPKPAAANPAAKPA